MAKIILADGSEVDVQEAKAMLNKGLEVVQSVAPTDKVDDTVSELFKVAEIVDSADSVIEDITALNEDLSKRVDVLTKKNLGLMQRFLEQGNEPEASEQTQTKLDKSRQMFGFW